MGCVEKKYIYANEFSLKKLYWGDILFIYYSGA